MKNPIKPPMAVEQYYRRIVIAVAAIAVVVAAVWILTGSASQTAAKTNPSLSTADADVSASASTSGTIAPNLIRVREHLFVPPGSPLRRRLLVQPVAATSAPAQTSLPAQVEADPARTVNIVPPAAGRVTELKVGLGDHVAKGQLLLVMTSGDVALAAADRDKARDAAQLSARVLERQRGMQEAGAGAGKDLEQAESNDAQARAEFARAEARLHSLGAFAASGNTNSGAGGRISIVAPISGSITSLAAAVGMSANDPTAVLMTVANLDTVWITANVPENMLSQIEKGQTVAIGLPAYPELSLHGVVAFVSDVLQPDTRRAAIRIVIRNTSLGGAVRLKPNMYATASFAVAAAATPAVPASALLMNNDSTTVFVETAPWTFVRRTIEPGSEADGHVRVLSGLHTGERIVVSGGVLLND